MSGVHTLDIEAFVIVNNIDITKYALDCVGDFAEEPDGSLEAEGGGGGGGLGLSCGGHFLSLLMCWTDLGTSIFQVVQFF